MGTDDFLTRARASFYQRENSTQSQVAFYQACDNWLVDGLFREVERLGGHLRWALMELGDDHQWTDEKPLRAAWQALSDAEGSPT